MKKLLAIGVGAAMLLSFTPPVEAGINWGSVIKVAGDAVQSAGSSSKKQSSKQQKSGKSAQEVNATIPTALALGHQMKARLDQIGLIIAPTLG